MHPTIQRCILPIGTVQYRQFSVALTQNFLCHLHHHCGLLQVTFCPELPAKAAENIQLLSLPNLNLPLYTHSFLGFGQEAALTLASTAAVGKRLQVQNSPETEQQQQGMV